MVNHPGWDATTNAHFHYITLGMALHPKRRCHSECDRAKKGYIMINSLILFIRLSHSLKDFMIYSAKLFKTFGLVELSNVIQL